MFTKDLGRRIAFAANIAGLSFPGKPLVEASEDLHNFQGTGRSVGYGSIQRLRKKRFASDG